MNFHSSLFDTGLSRAVPFFRLLGLLLVLTLFTATASQASATLLGDYIAAEMLLKDDPNLGNMFDPAPKPGCPTCTVPAFPASSSLQPLAVVLDPDVIFPEFVFEKVGEYDLDLDVDSTSINVAMINASGSPALVTPEGWEIRITDLNWNDGGVPGVLTSASIVDPNLFPGLSVSVINGGTGLLLDYPGAAGSNPNILSTYNSHNQLAATIVFTTQPAVPEPATLATLGMGVVTLLMRRHRRAG